MKVKVKYRAIGLRGESLTEVIEHDLPEFEEKRGVMQLVSDGRQVPHEYIVSVDQQIMDHLDDMDKKDLMDDRDWYAIVDYEIHQEVTSEDQAQVFKTLVDIFTQDETTRNSLYVAYVSLYETIKGETLQKQFDIVVASLGLALKSQSYAYQRMIDLLRNDPKNYDKKSDFKLINPEDNE